MTSEGEVAGTASATTGSSGTVTGAGSTTGTASAVTGTSGALAGAGAAAGTAAAVTAASGTLTAFDFVSGTAAATTSASATPSQPSAVVGSALMWSGPREEGDTTGERRARGRRSRKTAAERALEKEQDVAAVVPIESAPAPSPAPAPPKPSPKPAAPAIPVYLLRAISKLGAPRSRASVLAFAPTSITARSTLGAPTTEIVAHHIPHVASASSVVVGQVRLRGFAAVSPSPAPMAARIAELEQQLAGRAVQDAVPPAVVERVVERVVQLPPREIIREVRVPVYERIPVIEVVHRDVPMAIYLDALDEEDARDEPFETLYLDAANDGDDTEERFEAMYPDEDDDLDEDADGEPCAPMADCPPESIVLSSPTVTSPTTFRVEESKAAAKKRRPKTPRQDAADRAKRRKLHDALTAPRAVEIRYKTDLVGLLAAVHRGVVKLVHEELLPHRPGPVQRQDAELLSDVTWADNLAKATDGVDLLLRLRLDAGWVDRVKTAIDGLKDKVSKYLRPKVVVSFDRMATRVNANGAKAATLIGIQPKVAGLSGIVDDAREATIGFITNAGDIYLDQVEDILTDPDNFNLPVDELADLLEERGNVSASRARTIATTSTLQLNSILTTTRARAAKIGRFVWSSSRDERVRGAPGGPYAKADPSHYDLDGQEYDYDDPPESDTDGNPALPGIPINCRCVAVPVIDDDEEADPEGPEEPDTEADVDEPEAEPEAAE
jgi:SPP1 gp7 family putative phage head morphogenesis protein